MCGVNNDQLGVPSGNAGQVNMALLMATKKFSSTSATKMEPININEEEAADRNSGLKGIKTSPTLKEPEGMVQKTLMDQKEEGTKMLRKTGSDSNHHLQLTGAETTSNLLKELSKESEELSGSLKRVRSNTYIRFSMDKARKKPRETAKADTTKRLSKISITVHRMAIPATNFLGTNTKKTQLVKTRLCLEGRLQVSQNATTKRYLDVTCPDESSKDWLGKAMTSSE